MYIYVHVFFHWSQTEIQPFKTAVIFNIHNKVVNVNSWDAKATSNSAKQRLKTIRLIGFLVYAVNF